VTAPDPAKKLHALLKTLRADYGELCPDAECEGCPEGADRLLWRLVYSFMAWEASPAKASHATKRLHASVIDYNEMRVCLADELSLMIGERYPRGVERCARMRSSLNELFRREHAVTMARAAGLAKREAREYLESLEGMPPYVAARMSLVALGGHAFPLDERLYQTLLEESALPADLSLDDAAGWLERQFRAGEVLQPYLLLERWMNDRPAPKLAKKPPARTDILKSKTEPVQAERPKAGAKPKRAGKP
jgi:hypothetical protein